MSETKESAEDPRLRAAEEARSLLENARRIREEMGEERWRTATRLFFMVRGALVGSLLGLLVGFILLVQIGADWVRQRIDTHHYWEHTGWVKHAPVYLAVAVGVLVLLFVAGLVVTKLLRGAVEEAADEDPERAEVIWEALTAGARARELREEGEAEADDGRDRWEFEAEGIGRKRWWLVELSGAHLLWWISFVALAVYLWEDSDWYRGAPDWVLSVVTSVALSGVVLKGLIPLFLLEKSGKEARRGIDRRDAIRYYGWWAKGWLPVVVALLPAAAWWTGQAVGW